MTHSPAVAAPGLVVRERDLPHPPEKVWRALTTPHLLAEWLMAGDIAPVPGHAFRFEADWGGVDCRVIEAEAERRLSMTWVGMGVDTVVEFTLTPTPAGTLLRVEQSGFDDGNPMALRGATAGWPRFLDRLAGLLDRDGTGDDAGDGAA